MKNHIDVLPTKNDVNKNKVSTSTKNSTGESFNTIFNKAILNQNSNSIKFNSTKVSDVSSIEDISENLKEQLDQRVDDALERLSNFFGFGKYLMEAILKYMHIDPEDLLDPNKKSNIVKALVKQFGLSKDKSDALSLLVSDLQK